MIALSEPLPLRTTAEWSLFREARVIPHRYGRVGGALLQYDEARRIFVWADHPCAGVDEVLVGGALASGWVTRNRQDSTGRACCFVEFAEPVEDGAEVIARGRGKLHPVTGALITNPATIVWDILANIAGRSVAESQLDSFRAQSAVEGLVCAGSIEAPITLQAAAREVCASVGAVFCPTAHGLARLWPGAELDAARITVERGEASARASLGELVNDLTVQFDVEAGTPRRALQIDAPDAVADLRRRPAVAELRWVAEPRIALSIATRLLQQRARPQWVVRTAVRGRVAVGDAVVLDHDALPVTGTGMVLEHEWQPDSEAQSIGLVMPVGDLPAVRLLRQSQRAELLPFAGVAVETAGDVRVVTLREEDGRPIVGAQVTLNGQLVRTTDGAGRVSFPASAMPRGEHTLAVLTGDGRSLSTIVLVQ